MKDADFPGKGATSGFRFNGGPVAVIHEHGHRVPTRNVDHGIMVGMLADMAGVTMERRLALAAFTVNGSAGWQLALLSKGTSARTYPASRKYQTSQKGGENIPNRGPSGAKSSACRLLHQEIPWSGTTPLLRFRTPPVPITSGDQGSRPEIARLVRAVEEHGREYSQTSRRHDAVSRHVENLLNVA